jgi:prophage regulatory protein
MIKSSHETSTLKIIRRKQVEARVGLSRSSIYAAIAQGTFPKPVNIGARAVGWPAHECDEIIAARVAGKADSEIRELVARLVAARASLV